MNDTAGFSPILYVKQGCTFSLKVRLFLLEAGLLDRFRVVQAATVEEHQELVQMLAGRLGKASFPTAEVDDGVLLSDSDALIAYVSKAAGISPAQLPTFQAYAASVFPHYLQLYRENGELKKQRA